MRFSRVALLLIVFAIATKPGAATAQTPFSVPYGFFGGRTAALTPWGAPLTSLGVACFDRPVRAIEPVAPDRWAVGGDFGMAGRCTGTGVPVLPSGETVPGFDPATMAFDNSITNAVPDGAGGWYVGGAFSKVGTVPRDRLAHINADGTLDLTFNPVLPASSGPIYDLAFDAARARLYFSGVFTENFPRYGTTVDPVTGDVTWPTSLYDRGFFSGAVKSVISDGAGGWYAAGSFTAFQGVVTGAVIHINADGTLDTNFQPDVFEGNLGYVSVEALYLDGSSLWVGGTFGSVKGAAHSNLVVLDATTGALVAAPEPDGPVTALTKAGGKIIAGGGFNGVGATAYGNGAIFAANGAVSAPGLQIEGSVDAAVSDGAGGWYIAGSFSKINGVARANLARINADGSLHAWQAAAAPSSSPSSIAFGGGRVFIGGLFTSVGGSTRNRVAAFNASTGALDSWYPTGGANGNVETISYSGGVLYVSGSFSSIGGQSRTRIAAIDGSTGAVTSWYPTGGMSGTADAMAVGSGVIYLGGTFSTVGGQSRSNLAAVDLTTAAVTSWYPTGGAGGFVDAIAVDGSTVYVGGGFSTVGGQSRSRIAALDATTGTPSSWAPVGATDGSVEDIAVSGGKIIAIGLFKTIGGQSRRYLAALDAGTGAALSWASDAINGLSPEVVAIGTGGEVFVGGNFSSVGGTLRENIMAFSAPGTLSSWYPTDGVDGQVWALATSGNTIYAGGVFIEAGGQSRSNLAGFDATTAAVTSWYPSNGANAWVYDLAVAGSTVYAVGVFTTVGGQSRARAAALDATTGVPSSWNPGANSTVSSVAVGPTGTVYLGGVFTTVAGQPRSNMAAVDASGNLLPWSPGSIGAWVDTIVFDGAGAMFVGGSVASIGSPKMNKVGVVSTLTSSLSWAPSGTLNGVVAAIALAPSGTLYAGGTFTTYNGVATGRLMALDTSGNKTSWAPVADGIVNALLVDASENIYVGGDFQNLGGSSRKRIGALNSAGTLLSWYPTGGVNGLVNTLAMDGGGNIYLGGDFTTVGGMGRTQLASLTPAGAVGSWAPVPISYTGGSIQNLVVDGSTVYIAGAFDTVGGLVRNGAAATDLAGTVLSWAPRLPVQSGAMAAVPNGSGRVFLATQSYVINELPRSGIAIVDDAGRLTDWTGALAGPAGSPPSVNALAFRNGNLLVGGEFTEVGGVARRRLAAFNSSGALQSWYPTNGANSTVSAFAMTPDGSALYVGGSFTSLGGSTRRSLAGVDPTTGALLSWYPTNGTDGSVSSMALDAAGTVYLGGYFGTVGGQTRMNVAAVNASGTVTSWYPAGGTGVDYLQVNAVAVDSTGTVYLGGYFESMGGQARKYVAAVDSAGSVTSWMGTNGADSSVMSLGVGPDDRVYVGGFFQKLDAQTRKGFAVVSAAGALDPLSPTEQVSGSYVIRAGPAGSLWLGGVFFISGSTPRSGLLKLSLTTGGVQ